MYSNVSVVNNKARLDLALNAPEFFLDQSILDDFHQQMLARANDSGLDDIVRASLQLLIVCISSIIRQ